MGTGQVLARLLLQAGRGWVRTKLQGWNERTAISDGSNICTLLSAQLFLDWPRREVRDRSRNLVCTLLCLVWLRLQVLNIKQAT